MSKNFTMAKAEEVLREIEEYRDLYEEAPIAYYSIGLDGRILRANRRGEELLGYSVEELIGRPMLDLYANTPAGKGKAQTLFQHFRAGEEIHGEELEMRRADGKSIWVSLTVRPMRNLAGEVTASRSMAVDITERKRAEEEVRTTQKMLSEAERLANAGSFQWDIAANKVTWSDGLYHIYGLKPQEFGASFEAFLNQVHPDSREIVRQTIETAYRDCKPFQMEERIVRSDGEIRVLFSKGEIITNDQGTPVRMVGSCQDVTERKKAEEARISSLEEARMARNIQVNLLPQSNPDVAGYDIAGMSIPALNVGGDYYDFIRLDDYRLAISLGDVSGKGLAASLVMSNLQATIRGQTFFEANAKGCLERANTLLFHSTDSRTFVSLFYGILDTQKNTLCYSNAGHDIPLIFSAGRKPNPLKTRGIALGLKENVSYVKEERSIHPNDLVLIYSDGISEAMNERKEEFGDKRLQEIVQHNSGDSARELIDKIIAAANLHFGNASQNDDMTIIIIKRTP